MTAAFPNCNKYMRKFNLFSTFCVLRNIYSPNNSPNKNFFAQRKYTHTHTLWHKTQDDVENIYLKTFKKREYIVRVLGWVNKKKLYIYRKKHSLKTFFGSTMSARPCLCSFEWRKFSPLFVVNRSRQEIFKNDSD